MGDDISIGEFQGINFSKVLTFISENPNLAKTLQDGDPHAIDQLIKDGKLNELFGALGLDPKNPDDKEKLKKILETFLKVGPGLNGMISNLANSLMAQMMGGENNLLREMATLKGGEFEGADKDPEKFLGMLQDLVPEHKTTKMLTNLDNIRKEYNKDGNGLKAMANVVKEVGIENSYNIYQGIVSGKDPINVVGQVIGLDNLVKEANEAAAKKLPEAKAEAAKASAPEDKIDKAPASGDRTVTMLTGQERNMAFDSLAEFESKAKNAKGEYNPGYKYEKSGKPEIHRFSFPNEKEALEFMHKARTAGLEVKGHADLEKLYNKMYEKPQAAAIKSDTLGPIRVTNTDIQADMRAVSVLKTEVETKNHLKDEAEKKLQQIAEEVAFDERSLERAHAELEQLKQATEEYRTSAEAVEEEVKQKEAQVKNQVEQVEKLTRDLDLKRDAHQQAQLARIDATTASAKAIADLKAAEEREAKSHFDHVASKQIAAESELKTARTKRDDANSTLENATQVLNEANENLFLAEENVKKARDNLELANKSVENALVKLEDTKKNEQLLTAKEQSLSAELKKQEEIAAALTKFNDPGDPESKSELLGRIYDLQHPDKGGDTDKEREEFIEKYTSGGAGELNKMNSETESNISKLKRDIEVNNDELKKARGAVEKEGLHLQKQREEGDVASKTLRESEENRANSVKIQESAKLEKERKVAAASIAEDHFKKRSLNFEQAKEATGEAKGKLNQATKAANDANQEYKKHAVAAQQYRNEIARSSKSTASAPKKVTIPAGQEQKTAFDPISDEYSEE